MSAREAPVTAEIARAHGLSDEEFALCRSIMGRDPNITELGIFSVMWSEHCSYKSSKKWLQDAADHRALGDLRPGRECRRDRYRRRHGRHLQDGEPQPSDLHRALSGRGDRRRRHPARRLHHGRAARRQHERAALRRSRPPETRALVSGVVGGIGGYGNCVGVPTVGGETNFHAGYNGNILVNAMTVGLAPRRQDLLFGRRGRRQSGRLCRLEDRPRRHPRRHHGLGRVLRRDRGQAPDRAGRRSVHREAADRGLPRTDGHRRDRRHPGHGRGRAHLVVGRDGGEGRARHRARSRPRAAARGRHDRL